MVGLEERFLPGPNISSKDGVTVGWESTFLAILAPSSCIGLI